MTITIRHTQCWNCGHVNNAASSPTTPEEIPRDGDISCCWVCGELAFFDSTREEGLRKPWLHEMDQLLKEPEVIEMLVYWQRNRGTVQ